jgi:alpha-mannosidase
MERETERRIVSAEKLGVLATLVDSRFQTPRAALADVWENINLMNEHTWGWGRSITEPFSEDTTRELNYKRAFGTRARDQMEYVLDRSMTALAGSIKTPQRALIVFNTLNWTRNGWVEFDLQKTRELLDIEIGQTVGFEVLQDQPAYQRIRFLARDVPAIGYRTYEIRDKAVTDVTVDQPSAERPAGATPNAAPQPATQNESQNQTSDSTTLENSYYRVTLDQQSGTVRSIFDKQLGRELVDASSPYRFNQYVYVTGGDDFPNQLLTYRKAAPLARLETHAASGGKLLSVSKTPSGTIARLESRGVNTPRISTEIILFDDEKKIEFINRVNKEMVYKKEAAYFAFPIAMRGPRFNFEVQTGTVDPAKEMIPGAGREWFSSQNWMSVSDAGASVGIINKDSFLWTFGDIVRGTWTKEFRPSTATAFSYVMNNYWNTNYIAAQGGEFTFRYVLTSDRNLDFAKLSRLGWQETTPLERILIKSQDQTFPAQKSLPAAKASLLQVENPSVILSALKEAEDSKGYIFRFIELGGNKSSVSISSPFLKSVSAQLCNAMEECGERLPRRANGFSFEASPRRIITTKVTNAQAK